MSRRRYNTSLHLLGLVSSLWLVLAGCGGQGGSDGGNAGSSATTRVHHLTVQLARAPEIAQPAQPQSSLAAQGRQVQPGEPAFIQQLVIQVQTPQGVDLLAPQVFALGPAEQETVALDLLLPEPPPATLQLVVAAFNDFQHQQTKIFLGQGLIERGQASATLTLVRNPDPATFIPVQATPATLQERVFTFPDGTVFGVRLGGTPVTLTIGRFQGPNGDFLLTAGGRAAGGALTTLGSCLLVVTASTFAPGQGPQGGDQITWDPCQVDAIDGRLLATDTRLLLQATSEAPLAAASTGGMQLPDPLPTLVLAEDTEGAVQIVVRLVGERPGTITFTLTTSPAHGTAVVESTGRVQYRPAAHFHGHDRLVVTITATFSDGLTPPFMFGTLPIAITVQPRNDPPSLTHPGNQTTPEGTTVSLQISASDPDGDARTFSATGLPPGLNINATTGRISGTVAQGAALGSPYSVTVSVSDSIAPPVSASFTWNVILSPNIQVSIGSPPAPVAHGETFTVPVTFATGSTSILSYLLQLSFDASVVKVVDIVGLIPFDNAVTNRTAFASGPVKFAANNSTFTPAYDVFNVVNITFEVVGNAGTTSALQLAFTPTPGGTSVLVNDAFQPIPITAVTFTSGSVVVSGEQTSIRSVDRAKDNETR